MKNILLPMVCDLFHYGHLSFIKNVRENNINSKIIIGLHPDKDVERYKRLPILNLEERKKILEGCKYVDEIIACPIDKHLEIVEKYNIDIIIHAHNIEEDEKYRSMWKNLEEKFIRYDYCEGISTTEIINRIKKNNI